MKTTHQNDCMHSSRLPTGRVLHLKNPDGIRLQSPRVAESARLRWDTRGFLPQPHSEPNRRNPVGVKELFAPLRRVARPSRPWALLQNPVGIRPG